MKAGKAGRGLEEGMAAPGEKGSPVLHRDHWGRAGEGRRLEVGGNNLWYTQSQGTTAGQICSMVGALSGDTEGMCHS